MKYMLLIYHDEHRWNELLETEREQSRTIARFHSRRTRSSNSTSEGV